MRDPAVARLRGRAEERRGRRTPSRPSSSDGRPTIPFDFASETIRRRDAGDDVERPEAGEDDPALIEPVLEALKTVRDPEIPVNLVDLGLIYELIVNKDGIVYVEMTLTTPACPVAAQHAGRGRERGHAASPASRTRASSWCGRRPGPRTG